MDLTMEVSMRSESTVSPFRYGLSRIMIDSSAVYAVIFFRSFVFLRINFSRLPFSRRARSFSCATSRRGADAASFEAKVNSAMFFADKVSRCAILSNAFMRVWPSGKAKASQSISRPIFQETHKTDNHKKPVQRRTFRHAFVFPSVRETGETRVFDELLTNVRILDPAGPCNRGFVCVRFVAASSLPALRTIGDRL